MRAPDFWHSDGLVPRLLSPASACWHTASRIRSRRAEPSRVERPVICVGNAVVGGAGKTPVALSIADLLTDYGPHFLSRGYGGTVSGPVRVDPSRHDVHDIGDEALLLAAAAPTWVSRDRAAGARAAVSAGAGVVVMDDGLQNFSLIKDLSLLVVDGGFGFGNGRLLPAGPLREPVAEAVARADAVVIVGDDRAGIRDGLDREAFAARLVPDASSLRDRPVVAFAGIGRPQKFYQTLEEIGCTPVATRNFPDHHLYSEKEVGDLLELAESAGVALVTTEKDAVRLPEFAAGKVETLGVTIEWENPATLKELLASTIARAEHG